MDVLKESLQRAAANYDIFLASQQADLLLQYLELVNKKNENLNLTCITDIQEGVYLHLLDSLLFVNCFQGLQEEGLFEEKVRFVDMGTGGGFPGGPFGIATGESGVLLDSVSKKAAAVQEMLEKLGLSPQIKAEGKRIEDKAREKQGAFSVALARALAPLEILLEYASPLLSPGGFLIASKAHPRSEELEAAKIAAPKAGMEHVSRETFELPERMGHRELFIYQKAYQPQIKLPRKAGMAQKRPLSTLSSS